MISPVGACNILDISLPVLRLRLQEAPVSLPNAPVDVGLGKNNWWRWKDEAHVRAWATEYLAWKEQQATQTQSARRGKKNESPLATALNVEQHVQERLTTAEEALHAATERLRILEGWMATMQGAAMTIPPPSELPTAILLATARLALSNEAAQLGGYAVGPWINSTAGDGLECWYRHAIMQRHPSKCVVNTYRVGDALHTHWEVMLNRTQITLSGSLPGEHVEAARALVDAFLQLAQVRMLTGDEIQALPEGSLP